jgi:hypothetical protein
VPMTDTFIVGIYFGHRIVSWPFGRLDVTPDQIAVRSWPTGHRSVAVPFNNVKAINIKKGRALSTLTVEDVVGKFKTVAVEMPFAVNRIATQLKKHGYEVTRVRER